MPDHSEAINAHYGAEDICTRILASLRRAGKDPASVSRDDLAPFDEFHGGGRASTRELAGIARLERGESVLDVGAGVGGPARTLSAEFGCRVTGIDVTAEFCRAARMLTEMVGMSNDIEFHCADAIEMPFADASFDVVWSQNTLMNIENKPGLFREVHRVLVPGGRFAFESVVAGSVTPIHFPVFWAHEPSLSFLASAHEMRSALTGAGLDERIWEDATAHSLALARKRLAALSRDGPPALDMSVIVPKDMPRKMQNSLRNNEEGRTHAVQAVYVKPCSRSGR